MKDSFTQQAFKDADEALMHEQAEAWASFSTGFDEKESMSFHLSVIAEGVNLLKLIKAAKDADCTTELHEYKNYAMMYGFKAGFEACMLSKTAK